MCLKNFLINGICISNAAQADSWVIYFYRVLKASANRNFLQRMIDCRFLPFTMILMWNSKQKSFECFPQVCIFMAISQLRLKQLKSLKRKFTSLSRLKRSSPLKYLSPDLYAIPNSVFSACLHAYEFCYLILIHHME